MTVETMSPRTRTTRRPRAWIAIAVGVAVVGGVAGYQLLTDDEFPQGSHPVEVYTVVDEFTKSGADGNHLLGMCDADSYYIKVDSAELCVVLNGSLGTVRAEGTKDGIVLDAEAAKAVQGMVRRSDAGGPDRTTQVLFEYQGSPVAVVPAAALQTGRAVTATSLG
jgi:hypothetical protein